MDFLRHFSRRHATLLIALAFFLVNVMIRLPNLHYPNYPVFDEAYFATFAADYATRNPHIDIHPPLGGMLYALPLLFSPQTAYERTAYIDYNFLNQETKTPPRQSYGTFPYFQLRLLSVLFGALLASGVFLFTKELSGHMPAAFLAASLISLENAMILETKLVLLNGMFLALGFWGLYLMLKNRPAWSGVFVGLAVSVKLIAGIFGIMGLILASTFKKTEMRRSLAFLFAAGATFLTLVFIVENMWVPVTKKESFFEEKIFSPLRAMPEWQTLQPSNFGKRLASLIPQNIVPYVRIVGVQALLSVGGYTLAGGGPDFAVSPWYGWPVMFGVFPYHFEFGDMTRPALVLLGNPVVWGLGTAGALVGVKRMFERARRKRKGESVKERGAIEFLTLSYLIYLGLFLTLVRRDAFLYHYFPSLIISVILFSILFSEFVDRKPRRKRYWWYTSLLSLALLGFIFISPFTYGTPITF